MRVLVRVLPTLSAIVVAMASFALSYVALRDVAARTHAVPGNMAWLTPICVDGAVLAASASLWSSSMRGQRKDPVAVLTAVVLLVISVIININHAGPEILAKVIAALPPLTLLACLELVANQYRRDALTEEAEAEATAPETVHETTVREAVPARATVSTQPTPEPTPQQTLQPTPQPTAARLALASTSAPATTATSPASTSSSAASSAVAAPKPAPGPAQAPAAAAVSPGVDAAARKNVSAAAAGEEVSGAVRIRQMFQEHLDGGGDVTDPTLTRKFAEALDLQPAYVRKVLGPLRRELQPAM